MNIWDLTKKHIKKGKTVKSLCPYTYEQEKNIIFYLGKEKTQNSKFQLFYKYFFELTP